MKTIKLLSVLFAAALVGASCSNSSGESESSNDPFIGNWTLRAIYVIQTGETADVTNVACTNNSNAKVTNDTAVISLYVNNNGQCTPATDTYKWVNEKGVYYIVVNDQKVEAPIQLNDDNQTLQITYQNEGYIFVFRKA
ncbi:MAG: hypothetical protein Q4G08_01355 [Capnocytophaga sp.]|nr:hypothetical protein [Capnocytophaga sp.]